MLWTQIGLVLDVVGVMMLFWWGPPMPDLNPKISLQLEGSEDAKTQKKRCCYEVMSRIALLVVLLGFVCQLLGTCPRSE